MKYMSLEAIYSQPRSATVVCHSFCCLTGPLMNLDPPSICLPCLYLAEVVAVASCHSTGHSAVCVAGTHQTACLADLAALRSGSGDK